jgi:hypothetical protein
LDGADLSDGDNLSGSSTSSLTIYSAEAGDAGKYTVVVSNEKGSVTSDAATLTLETPPSILTQPLNQAVIAGHDAVFTVKVSGSAPLTYRWQLNGYDLSNGHGVSGATTDKLVVDASAANDGDAFSVLVSNEVGSTNSDEAYLYVQSPPSIVSRPVKQTVAVGANTGFSVEAAGTGPLTYQWKRGGIDLTDGATYSGSTTANLSIYNVQTAQAGAYEVVIRNAVGSATGPSATLTVDLPPSVTSEPTNQTVAAGATATFSVKAVGTGPLHYQWQFNGTNLIGASTAKLTLRKVQAGAAGSYTVVITNLVGLAVSSNAVLTVSAAAQSDLRHQAGVDGNRGASWVNASRPVITGAQILPGGAFQFSIAGASAQALIIQSSTTLLPGSWVNVSTNAVVHGQVIFTESNPSQDQRQFYRALSQP